MALSALQTCMFLGLALFTLLHGLWWVSLLLLVTTVSCVFLSIRGYTVTSDAILVHRLFWVTRLPLAGLQSAKPQPGGLWQGIRIGNGGFFSFTGWRYSPGMGLYRVFVTDPKHAVVLQYARRKLVVSPCAPEEFVHDLSIPSHAA